MSFTVNFYKFSKKENSTAQPSAAPVSYDCILLSGSGLVNPTIIIDYGFQAAPDFNYCIIPAFDRSYWIQEWTFSGARWSAALSVDVLGTYKAEIGSSHLYALRASNPSLIDGSIVDNFYPTKTGCTFQQDIIASPWLTNNSGCYCLGVTNNNPDFGSLKYYILRPQDMASIISYLLSDDILHDNQFDATNASFALQKSVIDPSQYIKSCVYLPVSYDSLIIKYPNTAPVTVFDWAIRDGNGNDIVAPYVVATDPVLLLAQSFTIPKHPQTQSRGNFVNGAPYTILTLFMPPFGVLDIDTSLTAGAQNIITQTEMDIPSGLGVMTVTINGAIINRIEAMIGIPIQLSQVSRDYPGAASSILGGIGSVVDKVLSGNKAGAIISGVSSVGNAAMQLMARSQTIGQGGTYAQLTRAPGLYAQFFTIVDDDVDCNGRPCCKLIYPSSGGYFLIQDADISIDATASELSEIRRFLESGFYWE